MGAWRGCTEWRFSEEILRQAWRAYSAWTSCWKIWGFSARVRGKRGKRGYNKDGRANGYKGRALRPVSGWAADREVVWEIRAGDAEVDVWVLGWHRSWIINCRYSVCSKTYFSPVFLHHSTV